jgi:hypothetical protein
MILENIPSCRPCWDKLEKVGWNAGQAFESHGVRFGIRATEPAVLERLAALLPPGSVPLPLPLVETLYSLKIAPAEPRPGIRHWHLLYQGVTLIARTRVLEEALDALESDLHRQVAEQAQDTLFVHAGVVGWQGRAVVIPGCSFSGKTRLTAALVRAGAEYFSDEYAVFDASGLVWPYPKPLSLRGDGGLPLQKRSAASLGGHSAAAPLPVGLILETRYVPGAAWRPRGISPGAALLTLLGNTVQARRQPQTALSILEKAASGASGVKSRRGDADAVAAWVLANFSETGNF